jgi:hypothetical protein
MIHGIPGNERLIIDASLIEQTHHAHTACNLSSIKHWHRHPFCSTTSTGTSRSIATTAIYASEHGGCISQ